MDRETETDAKEKANLRRQRHQTGKKETWGAESHEGE